MQTTNNEPLGAGLVSTLPELLCRTTERASQNTLCANPQPGWSQGSKETQLPDLAPLRALPGWWRSQRVYPLCWGCAVDTSLTCLSCCPQENGNKAPSPVLGSWVCSTTKCSSACGQYVVMLVREGTKESTNAIENKVTIVMENVGYLTKHGKKAFSGSFKGSKPWGQKVL